MPRKRKISENQNGATNGSTEGSTEQTTVKKKPAQKRKPVTNPAPGNIEATSSVEVSDEAIRVRAYHIAEERARRGLTGDKNSDWLEARRQLLAERG